MKYSKTADLLCEMGRFGQKTGAGWYDYQAGKRDAIPSDVVNKMIEEHRKTLSVAPARCPTRKSCSAWCSRWSTKAPDSGGGHCQQVRRHRHGVPDGLRLPIHRGGPMHYASEVGLFNVVQAMNRFAQNPMDDASAWAPAPLLVKAGR